MDCTNCKENCAFVKSGFIKNDSECPNYIEGWWQVSGESSPRLVKDCFVKRNTIEMCEISSKNLALQVVVQNLRNEIFELKNMLQAILEKSNEYIKETNKFNVESEIKKIGELK